jgi:hypothetical protein
VDGHAANGKTGALQAEVVDCIAIGLHDPFGNSGVEGPDGQPGADISPQTLLVIGRAVTGTHVDRHVHEWSILDTA